MQMKEVINFAKIKAPRGKVPSTDKSGKSSILYVIKTPIARTANISPCSIEIVISEFISKLLLYYFTNTAPSKAGLFLSSFNLFIVFSFTIFVVFFKLSTGISFGSAPSTKILFAIAPVCFPSS